jgi:hypothetical protein
MFEGAQPLDGSKATMVVGQDESFLRDDLCGTSAAENDDGIFDGGMVDTIDIFGGELQSHCLHLPDVELFKKGWDPHSLFCKQERREAVESKDQQYLFHQKMDLAWGELKVTDLFGLFEPHIFIVGPDQGNIAGSIAVVEIIGFIQHPELVLPGDFQRILKKVSVVGFQVYQSAGDQDLPVFFKEVWGGKPFSLLSPLGIGEGYPDLRDFTQSEEPVDKIYPLADEGDIIQSFILDGPRTSPEACAFQVDAYIVSLRFISCQSHSIFPFTTSQFQYDRMVVQEEIPAPFRLQAKAVMNFLKIGLKEVFEIQIFPEVNQLLLRHGIELSGEKPCGGEFSCANRSQQLQGLIPV